MAADTSTGRPRCPCTGATSSLKKVSSLSPSPIALVRLVFALPVLTREFPHHSSGNYGLMDQIAALEWIQRNIAAFGGDSKFVTIAGQSSASISVSILMASLLAKGLFQRAIGESGGLFEPLQLAPKFLLANAERDGDK